MNMKRFSILSIILGAVALVMGSCVKENAELPADSFLIDGEYLSFAVTQNDTMAFIPVRTNISESEWKMTSDAPWCSLGRSVSSERGLMLTILANTDWDKREAKLSAEAGGNHYDFTVRQLGYGPAIIVEDIFVGPAATNVTMKVVANIPYKVDDPVFDPVDNTVENEPWFFIPRTPTSRAFAEASYNFGVTSNMLPGPRRATVSVKATEEKHAQVIGKDGVVCTITQTAVPQTNTKIVAEKLIKPLNVKANQYSVKEASYQNGEPEKVNDANYATYYHSPWPDEGWTDTQGVQHTSTVFPVELEFELPGQQRLDLIRIMHRAYGTTNGAHPRGRIGQFNLYYKADAGDEWTLLGDAPFDLKKLGGYQTVRLPQSIENASFIKISILDGDVEPENRHKTDKDGNVTEEIEDPYITCAEIEFYNTNQSDVDEWIERIFTDASCSALKEGVTKKDIIDMFAVAPYLASNVAIPLLEGTYGPSANGKFDIDHKEYFFRTHSYPAYSDVSKINRIMYTKIYSALDNPTGVHVERDAEILVCLDKVPEGQTVYLGIYGDNGTGPVYGGGGENEDGEIFSLDKGINTITASTEGMVYVINSSSDLRVYNEPVRVHILPGKAPAGGDVQGYYDLTMTDADYKKILEEYTFKYFMAKGERFSFLFHTSEFKSKSRNSIESGVKAWDDIINWQFELMGIKDDPRFNNHMVGISDEKVTNPNASNRRVEFPFGYTSRIISYDALIEEEDNAWGPAHELGHNNQAAINWKSTMESSNNLFSNYVIYKFGKYSSRGKKISDLAAAYVDPEHKSWALLGKASYQGEDPELHMRMNWQLWNYFHRCGYQEDFFPTLFGLLREDPLPNDFTSSINPKIAEDLGASQLKYYEKVCEAAQMDLTEFFRVWGFFEPLNTSYSQYGSALYKVDAAMISASLARVSAKNYPKPAAPIQYIEDRETKYGEVYSQMGYYETYKNKVKITKAPGHTLDGRKVQVSNCDQAVAVEVRRGTEASGELLFFSNMYSFTLPESVPTTGISFWAVQYDGVRKKM